MTADKMAGQINHAAGEAHGSNKDQQIASDLERQAQQSHLTMPSVPAATIEDLQHQVKVLRDFATYLLKKHELHTDTQANHIIEEVLIWGSPK